MKTYNKLIRDRIPERIEKDGVAYTMRVLDEGEYRAELLKKLVEEAAEVLETKGDPHQLVVEIGDVLEVLDALIGAFSLDRDEIMRVKQERRETRGGFEKRLFLEEMGDPN